MWRSLPVGCVCLLCVSLQAESITYTVDVTGGSIGFGFSPPELATPNPVLSRADGTFDVTIDQGIDGVDAGDEIELGASAICSTDFLEWEFGGLGTATLPAGNLRLIDFDQSTPVAIGTGGSVTATVAALVDIEGLVVSGPPARRSPRPSGPSPEH